MKQLSTLNGKLPIRYGWGALSDFADSTDKTLDEVMYSFDPSKLKPREFSLFVFYGVKDGCEESNKDFPFESTKDVEKIINKHGLTVIIKEALAAFQESPFIVIEQEEEEDNDKKK